MTTPSYATKCRNGKSILYTQDRYCPAGYIDITGASGGTVSIVGRSAHVKEQENELLQRRATENGPYQMQMAQAQVAEEQQQAHNSALCTSLASQAKSLEAAMRQPNGPQWLDNLKQQHRNVRDQQYRNKC
ncbi:hypothetical protein [Cupriavidus sp. H39]|uniref:hypothetical protein n=1 Tax=Cupriavidus sp. H39 TaxID=3401635 RepID=UPI003D04962C